MEELIVIIDYGIGNINSILNMLKKIGANVIISGKSEDLLKADKLILPGVGAFDYGMTKLAESGLLEIVKEHALTKKKPLLGICLGMQMLGKSSEEGNLRGLNLIPFETKKFKFESTELRIPHMGWDLSEVCIERDELMYGIKETPRYYFVHSYHAVCDSQENELMSCNYGYKFSSAVKNENIYGVQFHPEKSHKFGMTLLENFVKRVK